jgi:hypothetical protein
MQKTNTTHPRRVRQGRPTRRAAAYERPYSILPEQFFDARVKLTAVCPETALMYAVLEDAFLCFQQQFEAGKPVQSAREADDWFFKDNSRWLFSFVSVCDALGLQPKYIRQKLKHWMPVRLQSTQAKPPLLPNKKNFQICPILDNPRF